MTYKVERIEEVLRHIFAKIFQCFHIHFKMWQQIINQELRKNPLGIGGISQSNFPRSVQMIIPSRENSFLVYYSPIPQWDYFDSLNKF